MLGGVVDRLAHGDDAEGVDGRMAPVVMVLDMVHVDGATNGGVLEQILRVVEEVWVLADELLVGLEVDDVDLVEADERHEQADVGLRELIAGNVALLGENLFALVQRREQLVEGLLVGLLHGGEAAAVDAVVDGVVGPAVDLFDVALQGLGVHVHLRMLRNVVELVVEHLGDLGALVVDDALRLRVQQHRDGVLARVPRACDLVELPNGLGLVERIGGRARHVIPFHREHPPVMLVNAGLG